MPPTPRPRAAPFSPAWCPCSWRAASTTRSRWPRCRGLPGPTRSRPRSCPEGPAPRRRIGEGGPPVRARGATWRTAPLDATTSGAAGQRARTLADGAGPPGSSIRAGLEMTGPLHARRGPDDMRIPGDSGRTARGAGFHADRAAGGDRDHRRPDRAAPARRPGGPRGGPADPVHQQPQAARPGAAELPLRITNCFPPGRLARPRVNGHLRRPSAAGARSRSCSPRWSSPRCTTRSTSASSTWATRPALATRRRSSSRRSTS